MRKPSMSGIFTTCLASNAWRRSAFSTSSGQRMNLCAQPCAFRSFVRMDSPFRRWSSPCRARRFMSMRSSPSSRAMRSKAVKPRASICSGGSLPNRLHLREGSGDGIPQSYVRQDIDRTAQRRVWGHLWRLIEDAAYAETQRVRTTFGQAVYDKMQTGHVYILTIQHNGGLLLQMRIP